MPEALQVLAAVAGALTCCGLSSILLLLWHEHTSPLNKLPGPPHSSWLTGNFKEIQSTDAAVFYEKWIPEYGPTLRYKFFLNMSCLYTTDTKALNHILQNNYIYHKPNLMRWNLGRITGPDGLLIVEDDKHKYQRRIMNPAFGTAQIREFNKTFIEKSIELRNVWISQIETQGTVLRIDALAWLGRMTLDVIGRTGSCSMIAINLVL